jgi:hypothetical protein
MKSGLITNVFGERGIHSVRNHEDAVKWKAAIADQPVDEIGRISNYAGVNRHLNLADLNLNLVRSSGAPG